MRLLAVAGASLVLVTGWCASAAASLYPLEPPYEFQSMAIVSRLSLQDGIGWLTARISVHSDRYTGFEVEIPAGGGRWAEGAPVAVPAMGIRCLEEPGPDLHYRCGQTHGIATGDALRSGAYQVSFRVERSGDPDGLLGHSSMAAVRLLDADVGYLGLFNSDVFPVHGTAHPRSTAEITMGMLMWAETRYVRAARLPVTVTVEPGERVTTLDIELPPAPYRWWITGTNASRLGLQCRILRPETILRCLPPTSGEGFPVGRYGLTVELSAAWPTVDDTPWPENTSATLTVDGDPQASYDDLPWRIPSFF